MSASHFYDTYSDEKPLENLIARLQLDLNGTDLSSDSPLPFSIKSNDDITVADYIGSCREGLAHLIGPSENLFLTILAF